MAWARWRVIVSAATSFSITWRRVGARPYVCANFGTGTWTEAQQWVEYCNSAEDTAMTRLRKQNGRSQPWKIPFWGLGNEMDGPWQMGHRSADDYGKFALEGAKLMKWTDPDIKLIAAGSSNYRPGSDWTSWNRTVLQYLNQHADYLSLHTYVGNPSNDFGDFMASSLELDQRTKTAKGISTLLYRASPATARSTLHGTSGMYGIGRAEISARTAHSRRALQPGRCAGGGDIPELLRQSRPHRKDGQHGSVSERYRADLLERQGNISANHLLPTLQMFASNSKGKALELFVDSPKYKTPRFDGVPFLDISGAYDNGSLVLNVVNRHRDQAIETEFEAEDKQFSGAVTVSEVNGPDIKSENDFGKTIVKPVERSISAEPRKLRCAFPPHSYTMLKVKPP